MSTSNPESPERFRLLATFLAGRPLAVLAAPAGEAAHTDGRGVFLSAAGSEGEQRRELVVQSALLGAGSLEGKFVRALRARPAVARRYLALEGRRALTDLAGRLPLAAALGSYGKPATTTADASLAVARSRAVVSDPPEWFGVIRPALLLASETPAGTRATDKDLRLRFDPGELLDPEDDEEADDAGAGGSRILKLFENPMTGPRMISQFLRKLIGTSRAPGNGESGAEIRISSLRKARPAGGDARPLPTRIHFVDADKPGAAIGIGGALYPEWDTYAGRYRPQWCRVLDYPLTVGTDIAAATVTRDDVLVRRLSRIGLGPRILPRRPDGDELDLEALVELVVDIRSGYSPPESVYLETRKAARDLGVLLLLDASGSATDTDEAGRAVYDHHRRAAATLAATLEELGDRVAVHAFRSDGRHSVHLPAIKTFDHRFGAIERARLNQLQPSNYTRLGAAIRGAGKILETGSGTPYRLLVVLSDGVPYDHGYEGRYAEADARKALEELRGDGIACLCLSVGAATDPDALERVFGSASCASAATLSELSPRMDQLFLAALRELSAPKPAGGMRRRGIGSSSPAGRQRRNS